MAKGGSHKPTNLPYLLMCESSADEAQVLVQSPAQGGICVPGLAPAALLLGDAVFLSPTGWQKSTTVANYQAMLGIVVGGRVSDMKVLQDDALIGQQITAAGQEVLVMIFGSAKTLADVALATIGVRVTGGAVVAGRVSTTGIAAGNHIGVTLTAQGTIGSVLNVSVGGGF